MMCLSHALLGCVLRISASFQRKVSTSWVVHCEQASRFFWLSCTFVCQKNEIASSSTPSASSKMYETKKLYNNVSLTQLSHWVKNSRATFSPEIAHSTRYSNTQSFSFVPSDWLASKKWACAAVYIVYIIHNLCSTRPSLYNILKK